MEDDPSFGDFVFKITNNGLPQMVIYEGTKKIYRGGTWNGDYFSGALPFLLKNEMNFKEERLISWSMPYLGSAFTRLVLHKLGLVQNLALNPQKDKWNPLHLYPSDRCD